MSRVIGIHLDVSEHRYPTMWHNHCQKQFLLTVRFVHCVSKPSLIFSFTSLSLSLSLSYSIACSLRFLQVWQHCLSFLSPSLSLSLSPSLTSISNTLMPYQKPYFLSYKHTRKRKSKNKKQPSKVPHFLRYAGSTTCLENHLFWLPKLASSTLRHLITTLPYGTGSNVCV